MSTSLNDNVLYCPECGTRVKKDFPACPNCKIKLQDSRETGVKKEAILPQEPSFKDEDFKKLSSIPVKSTVDKEPPEEIQIEKTNEPEEIKEKQGETENRGTSFEKAPESQDTRDEPEKTVENTLDKSKTKEKKEQE